MAVVGIVCEYNPFHLGHERQLRAIRAADPGAVILCAMSGNYVQRGEPAVYPRLVRAEAALACGADLVVELPLKVSLSSAEGFAAGAVGLLAGLGAEKLCFGAESGTGADFMAAARILLEPGFPERLRPYLDRGLPFAAAREQAFRDLGGDPAILTSPNNILGVEYCKAILAGTLNKAPNAQKSAEFSPSVRFADSSLQEGAKGFAMEPMVIRRGGDYHAVEADAINPSATALRELLGRGGDIGPYVPEKAMAAMAGAVPHSLELGEKAVLARLRSMTEAEFEALPYGGEGLWRKLMHESRRCRTLAQIRDGVKSKRYAMTRIQRMILCAYLGLTREDLERPAPYARILGFTERGREVLRHTSAPVRHLGERTKDPWEEIETRAQALYGLMAAQPEPCAERERVLLR